MFWKKILSGPGFEPAPSDTLAIQPGDVISTMPGDVIGTSLAKSVTNPGDVPFISASYIVYRGDLVPKIMASHRFK